MNNITFLERRITQLSFEINIKDFFNFCPYIADHP